MSLRFNGAWRFTPPRDGTFRNENIPDDAVNEFSRLAFRVAEQGNRWQILEHFKKSFSSSTGATYVSSSSESWAESDLVSAMHEAGNNPPLFLEALFDACETLRQTERELFIPEVRVINEVCQRHEIGYEIRAPDLVLREADIAPVEVHVPERPPSLAENAMDILQGSLRRSEELLAGGRDREAVQENLWLLETVSTAFRGLDNSAGVARGRYFNEIVRELRRNNRGTTLDRVLQWIENVHGFLSSPTGGGVRHGQDLGEGIPLNRNEARLFCNLIRSYLSFLLTEYQRQSQEGNSR